MWDNISLRKNSVREAIMAIRSVLRKTAIGLDPERFREAALETKEEILRQIDEALSLYWMSIRRRLKA